MKGYRRDEVGTKIRRRKKVKYMIDKLVRNKIERVTIPNPRQKGYVVKLWHQGPEDKCSHSGILHRKESSQKGIQGQHHLNLNQKRKSLEERNLHIQARQKVNPDVKLL